MEENIYTEDSCGLSFAWRREKGKITVTRCISCGERAVLPGLLDSEPVAAIGEYAFSGRRELAEIVLPSGLKSIGRHAFYNCRRLESVSLPAGAADVRDGAFKNCEGLHRVYFRLDRTGELCMKNILYDLEQDIQCGILDEGRDGKQEERIRLVFPKNTYEYIANDAARIFHEVAYGSGYYYRQCVSERDMDYGRYDELFDYASREERSGVLTWLAFCRLAYPYRLSKAAAGRYLGWIREHIEELVGMMIEKDDYVAAGRLITCEGLDSQDAGRIVHAARERGSAEYTGFFLTGRRERFGSAARSFEL